MCALAMVAALSQKAIQFSLETNWSSITNPCSKVLNNKLFYPKGLDNFHIKIGP